MSQAINFSISGLYTSLNDYNGLPPGALDEADNCEIRYKNVIEPRRGFDSLPNSAVNLAHFLRKTNFYVSGVNQLIGITSAGNLVYYNGSSWQSLPGSNSTNVVAPDSVNAKNRFVQAGQNLYITAQDGVRSFSSGSSAQVIRAGVPKGLNLQAATNGDSSGFFNNNVVKSTTGNTTSGSALLTGLVDTSSVAEGQYVGGAGIPVGSKILSISQSSTVLIETGNTTAGSASISNLTSNAGLAAGVLVSGSGIPSGAKVVSVTGSGPYSVTLDSNAYQTQTGIMLTFSSAIVITLDQNATVTASAVPISFYTGAQVGYRMVFKRVETDINGVVIMRLGTASAIAIATNVSGNSTNVTVTGTLPKNSSDRITHVQLYRSSQTPSTSVTPLDQYNLVYERTLTASDFTNRTVTITDNVPDSLVGIPLYSGSDQEGILQSADPPPMCYDLCNFQDFILYANITRPSTLKATVVAVGPPSGVQVGDTITISGSFQGASFSQVYTASNTENQAGRQFQVVTSGTPSQNITDTANSLIRVFNYDNAVPVHVILLSSATDLPGQLLFEADNPSLDTFTITASAHPSAYDPSLSSLPSQTNSINNGIAVSKSGENEAVPSTNLLRVGDSSYPVLRVIALRDYVIVLKANGVYKILGTTPSSLICNPFDPNTRIIGADTAVALNSAVWMLSNQGVVSISDGGVDAKSPPIDDQLNLLIGSYIDNLKATAFAVGYESDRKYILCVPLSTNPWAEKEFCFNYVTNAWTTWSRFLYSVFVHSIENKLYIGRADLIDQSVSKERKTGTYSDYADEGIAVTITGASGTSITLSDVSHVVAGDILYQDSTHFSPIIAVDLINSIVTVQYPLSFALGSATILKSYLCTITWKQVFGDNPAYERQYPEGVVVFKQTRFNQAVMRFLTDFSQSVSDVTITANSVAFWGLFNWGGVPFGSQVLPEKIRFYIPDNKQLGSYIRPSLRVQQAYSNFKLQGLSISYVDISEEVGL